MSVKTRVYLFAFIGSTIGSFIPSLWGDSFLSFTSVILGGILGLAGIYLALKMFN